MLTPLLYGKVPRPAWSALADLLGVCPENHLLHSEITTFLPVSSREWVAYCFSSSEQPTWFTHPDSSSPSPRLFLGRGVDAEPLPRQHPLHISLSCESCQAALLSRSSLDEGTDWNPPVPHSQSLWFWLGQIQSSKPQQSRKWKDSLPNRQVHIKKWLKLYIKDFASTDVHPLM